MSLLDDFAKFSGYQLASGDIDPMYPVLKEVYRAEALDPEIALWRTLLYVTWYHIGTAEAVWTRFPEPGLLDRPLSYYPTGIERRGFRGNDKGQALVNEVLTHLTEHYGSLVKWVDAIRHSTKPDAFLGWTEARKEFEGFSGNGPWSSYKWVDLLKNVHGYPFEAPDIGVGGQGDTAGPVCGMVALTGLSARDCITNFRKQRELLEMTRALGAPLGGLDQLETCLCDFNSLLKGSYYSGRDLDMLMQQLGGCSPVFWRARSAVFDDRSLGEVQGWHGIRKARDKVYSQGGRVLAPWDPL